MTTRQKAEIACRVFDARAIEKGMTPSEPVVDVRYDRILDDGKSLLKVQVKYAGCSSSNTSGAFLARLTTYYNGRIGQRSYSRDEVDAIVVYIPTKGCLCWFSPQIFEGKTMISIRTEKSKNGQSQGTYWFEDFKW